MSRHQHLRDHTAYDDSVRREAYERAMAMLDGRPGISLSAPNIDDVRAYSGPIVAGDHPRRLPSRHAQDR